MAESLYEKVKKLKEAENNGKGTGLYNYVKSQNVQLNMLDITNRLESVQNTSKKLYDSYKSRFYDENGSFINSYRGDTVDAYNTYLSKKSALDNQINYITSFLTENEKYLNPESVSSIRNYLSGHNETVSGMTKAYQSDKDYWSKWATEQDYNGFLLNDTTGYEAEDINTREEIYKSNESRIAELDKLIESFEFENETKPRISSRGKYVGTKVAPTSESQSKYDALVAERDKLKAQNTRYDQINGVYAEVKEYQGIENFSNLAAQGETIGVADYWDAFEYYTNYYNERQKILNNQDVYFDKAAALEELNAKAPKGINKLATYRHFINNYYTEDDNSSNPKSVSYEDLFNQIDINETSYRPEGYSNNVIDIIREGYGNNWDEITEEEYKVYSAKLANEGEEAAQEYLNKLQVIVDKRVSDKTSEENKKMYDEANWLEKVFLNVASVPANILGGAVGFLDDVGNYMNTGAFNPYSSGHSISQFATDVRYQTAQDLDAATGNFELLGQSLGDAYQSAMSGLDSLAGGLTFGSGYTMLMGMGAASNEAKRLYEQGASNEQIAAGGILAGAAEMIFEKISIDHFLGNFVNAPTMKWYQAVGQALIQGGIEASEEVCTEIANTLSNIAVMGSQSDWKQTIEKFKNQGYSDSEALTMAFKDLGGNVWDAFAGGLISGGLLGGGGAFINLAQNKTTESNAIKQDGANIVEFDNIEGLIAAARNLPNTKANAKLKALAEDMSGIDTTKLSKSEYKAFSNRAGKLYSMIQKANMESISSSKTDSAKATIKEKLIAKGIAETEADKMTNTIYSALYKKKNKIALSTAENKLLKNQAAKDVYDELKENDYDVKVNVSKAQERARGQYYETKSLTTDKNGSREIDTSDYAISDDGKTYIKGTDESVSITGIQSIKNGDMKVNLSNGKTESISNLDLGSESEAVIYQGILDMGIDAKSASIILDSYDGNTDATTFIYGVQDAIKYGQIGGKAYVNSGVFTSQLTEKQRNDFYRLGEMITERKSQNKAKAIQNAIKDNKDKGKVIGAVSFDGVDRNSLTERQRVTVDAIEATFSEIGINVVFFQSPVNERGVHVGENGSYDPTTNTIRLDISAGLSGQDTILFTAAHELTHFIAEWSDTKFKTFADFLVKNYAKQGVSVDELVRLKIERSKSSKTYDKPLTYDEAFEEVIADSCESFLRDSDLLNKLTELAKKDMTLFERIKDYIDGLFERLKKAYAGLTPDSYEANEVLKMKDCIEELRNMWVDAAMEARENFQAAGGKALKNTTSEGDVIKFSLMNRNTFESNVDAILSMNDRDALLNAEEGNFIRILDETPHIITDNVKDAENLEVIISFYSLYLAARKSGALEGHYHNLGDLVKNLPEYIANPQAIVRMNSGRLNLFTQIKTPKGDNGILSIELNSVKDINNKFDKYNLVITVYSANDNHTKNNIVDNGVKVEYEKEDLMQVNPQLCKWLAIVNKRSSKDSIDNPTKKVKENSTKKSDRTIETVNNTVFGEKQIDIGKTESGVKYQLRENKKIGQASINYNNRHMNVEAAILTTGVEVMHEMAEVMLPYLEQEGILPPDIPGKTIFKNGSYGRSGENTTLCVRTLTYEDFKDRVAEKIGRPLTVAESLLVSQKIYDIATEPQCIYCYVAADRKAYDDYLGEYWKAMDKNIKALRNGGDSKTLYQEYLNGRKDTTQQQKRWAMWESIAKSGKTYITAKDLTTKLKRDLAIAKKDAFSEQIKDAQRYAQSASWAKTVYDYRAYKGDILKMSQKFVDMLNSEYGLRMYSFSDYTPAFIVENMQMIIDASVKGLKSLAYTKDTDYAEIFASTGQAINVSCFAKYDLKTKTYVEDNRQGADWTKTKKLRNEFNNVGSVMVCTSDEMVKWALKQPWIDVIIPYHIVKTGTTIANEYGWNNYTSESSDKANGKAANIYPTEHNNSFDLYSKLINERGLTPRFSRYYAMVKTGEITKQQYMKLVNEVRLPASKLSAVKPIFNLDAAKKSFGVDNDGNVIKGGFVDKGGYMGGWYREGVDVNQEVLAVAKDIEMGKSSLDVDYGMSKASKVKVEEKYGIKRSDRYLEGMSESDQENAKKVISNLKTIAVGSRLLEGYATYTPERMDREIKNSSASGVSDYANSYITWVNPIDFVYATTTNEQFRARLKEEAGTLDIEKLQKETQPIHLTVNFETGEIVGHEGRHRMIALSEKGINKVAVIIDALNDNRYQTKPIEFMRLKGQIFDGDRQGTDFYIHDMLPLSERYADTARKLFTSKPKSNIQFSDRITSDMDADYMAAVNRGDMETAQRLVDEAAKKAFPNSKLIQEDGTFFKMWHHTNKSFDSFLPGTSSSSGRLKGIYFTPQEHSAMSRLGSIHKQYYLNVENFKFAFGVATDKVYVDKLRELQEGVTDRNEIAKINRKFKEETGVDAFFDWQNGWYNILTPEQIKSADPVTYDDDGNVIPLSERFDSKNVDIRYSDRDSQGNTLSANQIEFFKDSEVRWGDKLMPVYHGAKEEFTEFDSTKGYEKHRHGGLLWAAKDYEYAKDYSYSDEPIVMKGYLNITNMLDIGAIDSVMDYDGRLQEIADLVQLTPSELKAMVDFEHPHIYDITSSKKFKERIVELGYDGVVAWESGLQTFGFVNSNQFKNVDNKTPTSNPDIRYQARPTESVSNRSLLANALEGAVQNEVEKTKLAEYKNNIDRINAEEKKLSELRKQIHEMSFKPGKRDAATQEKLRKLRDEALRSTNRISLYDKKLLTLEASKPLMDVLKREKAKAVERQKTKDAETMAAYRKYQNEKFDAVKKQYQESRQKAVEGRHRTELRNKIKRVVNGLNQYLLKGSKDRHVMIGLQKSVAMALDAVNMDTVGADERVAKYNALISKATDPDVIVSLTETRDRIQQMGDRMNDKLDKLKSAYEEIKNSDDPDVANAYDEVIENAINSVIADVGETSLRNMTYTQLESVYDLYTMILTRVRGANESFKSAKNENIKIRGSRVTTEVERTGGNHPLSIKALGAVKGFAWNTLKPTYAFETIGSETLTEAFENVRSGEDTWATDVNEAKDYYKEKTDKYGFDSWDFKTRHTFKSTSGISFELSLEQIMSLYAYSKRKQAGLHLQYGGFVFDDSIEVVEKKHGVPIKYNVKTANAHNLSPETLSAIIGTLTTEQKSFVDEMQEYLSAVMGAKGNEVSLAMYGVKLFKEKFYFPLKSAKQFLFEQNQTAGEVRIKNAGFTKDVVPEAKNPVILSNFTDVWSNHVNDMAMYHSFVLALEDFNRIFNYKTPVDEKVATHSVKQSLQNAYGKSAVDYIKQLITDLNGGARVDSTTGILNKAIGKFKKASVFASASVVIQQPSAIGRAFAIIDPKYFATNPGIKGHKALWEEVKKYAPVAIIKEMGYFDTHVGKQTTEWIKAKEYNGIKDKAKALVTDSGYRDEILSKAPALADELAWSYIWQAVKKEMAATTNLQVGSEEFLQRCGKRFTEVVTKTQVYDSVLARSGMMRSNDTGMKMVTAFMAEPTTSLNMLTNALIQGKRGNKKFARKVVGGVVTSMILNSILVSLIYAARDDDDDETYLEKYVSALSGQLVDSVNPLTLIPWVKDIWSIVQGYDVERSDMSVVSDLWNAFSDLSNDNKSAYRKVEDFAGAVCSVFGLPIKNIMRDARSIYTVIDGAASGNKTTWAGIEDAIIEGVTGNDVTSMERAERLFNRGDTKSFNKTVSEMVQSKVDDGKTEKEAKSSVRSSFTSRYKKQYVSAAKSKNSTEMIRIRKLLHQTGLYGTLTELDETLKKWRTE